MKMFIEKFVSLTCEQLKLDSKLQWFCSLFHGQVRCLTLKHCWFLHREAGPGQGWEEHQLKDFLKFCVGLFYVSLHNV